MAVLILFSMMGAAGVLTGLLHARRLRRWAPRSSPDLTEYDPGPDFLDWLQAVAFVAAGMVILVIAIAQ